MSRREMLIASLQATVPDLIRNLRAVDEAAARWAPAPDAWSMLDVVAHLGYIEPLYLARLRRIVEQDNPFEPYLHPDRGAHDLARSLNELLQQFILRRAETVVFLQKLEQRDWARPVTHETMGPGRLRDHVQMLVEHDSDHLGQIITLREALEHSA
jgi:uncharacterized damage-inducible protein DinB